jgi:hypothetical protein
MLSQKPLCLLRIQPRWDLAEVQDADRASRQKPAFAEDLEARILIEASV